MAWSKEVVCLPIIFLPALIIRKKVFKKRIKFQIEIYIFLTAILLSDFAEGLRELILVSIKTFSITN